MPAGKAAPESLRPCSIRASAPAAQRGTQSGHASSSPKTHPGCRSRRDSGRRRRRSPRRRHPGGCRA
ncbi:hypothetical protein FHS98_001906 [Sphingomonas oligoaromativorans]|nr:hypothetical protein [Sphingomonas oligoaromativorans]